MRSRKPVSALLASALLWGALAAAPGQVGAADVRGTMKNQGKSGDLCTSNGDCQQKPAALSCVAAGEQKQCQAPPPPPPPRPIIHKVT